MKKECCDDYGIYFCFVSKYIANFFRSDKFSLAYIISGLSIDKQGLYHNHMGIIFS